MSSMSSVAGLSKYITTLPNTKFSIKAITIFTLIIGLLIGIIVPNGEKNIFYQILGAIIVSFMSFGLTSIICGVVIARAIHLMRGINLMVKHSMFLTFINGAAISFLTLVGVILSANPGTILAFLEFGCILIFAFSFIVFWSVTRIGLVKSSIIAFFQPLFSIIVLVLINFLGLNLISINLSISLIVKIIVGSLIFEIAIILFILTLAAPMKKNLKIEMLDLISLFVSHINDGTHLLEDKFTEVGQDIDTIVSVVSFKNEKGIKGLFISPAVHPGPLGNMGGGNMPTVLANKFEPFTMVAHGPSTHDFNPTHINEIDKIEESVKKAVSKIEYSNKASKFRRYSYKTANIGVQFFNKGMNVLSTFAPLGSDDIEFSVGLIMMIRASKKFDDTTAIIVDCHNSFSKESGQVLSGDSEVFELIEAIDIIESDEKYEGIKMGCDQSHLERLNKDNGIGDSGLKTMIIEVDGQRTAYLLFDSNNMEVGFRKEIIDAVCELDIDEAEVMTTDTHSVNTISRGYNPIGLSKREEIIEYTKTSVKKSIEDLEEVEAGCATEKIKSIRSFGPNNSTELISTISSTVQVSKIIAPITFIVAIFLNLLWLMY
ncbi:DUF2070 family protein [uncultured Methanobrevibacter sp.]|uniref:DUF2070 family protein n=1 Tax=uncultured Methanobrevibacter sp. TaxID=253161 RepID=UPI0025CFDB5D|nr:DUF2070 family protein [uncultured Methanobrevibacter sp.]